MPMNAVPFHLARAGVYRLLSLAFDYPSAELAQGLAHLQDQLATNAPEELTVRPALPTLEPDVSGDEYLRLFDRKVVCSPYESEHGMGNKSFTKSRDLADLAGYYAAFGVDLDAVTDELYDHIKVELEFMSILCAKEAYALANGLDDGLDVTRRAERDFLREHLGRWGPTFCQKLEGEAQNDFYRELAQLAEIWLEEELARLDVEPLPLVRMPAGAAHNDDMAADCISCPMATSTTGS